MNEYHKKLINDVLFVAILGVFIFLLGGFFYNLGPCYKYNREMWEAEQCNVAKVSGLGIFGLILFSVYWYMNYKEYGLKL